MISTETLQFFKELLDQVSLPASAPNFKEQAERITRVRRELESALKDSEPKTSKG
jgi:hypothetical protein